jgi:hypothetical protein
MNRPIPSACNRSPALGIGRSASASTGRGKGGVAVGGVQVTIWGVRGDRQGQRAIGETRTGSLRAQRFIAWTQCKCQSSYLLGSGIKLSRLLRIGDARRWDDR